MYYQKDMILTGKRTPWEIERQQGKEFLMALHHAIKNNELSINYQPRYNSDSGQTDILEALVRWHRKGFGAIDPGRIIDEANKFGLIYDLDLWVFEKCCEDLLRLRADVDKNLKIAVNISSQECGSRYHTERLLAICESHGLQLSDFEFEISESFQTNDIDNIKIFCETVTEHGATVSLDDFDTCYSPLVTLCELPVDCITINKNFDSRLDRNGRGEILRSNLINIAHEMKIKVVAKGIELASQRDQLIAMGCDQLQGFYICKPLESKSITMKHINMFA